MFSGALLALPDRLRAARMRARAGASARSRRALAALTLLAAAAPLVWILSDLRDHRRSAVVADEHPPHRAHARRASPGIGNVPEYIPRRIGEILRPAGARRRRARRRAVAAVAAPPRARRRASRACSRCSCSPRSPPSGCRSTRATRFLAAAILCVFCGARRVRLDSPAAAAIRRRRWWMARRRARARRARRLSRPRSTAAPTANWTNSARQQSIQDDLLALVDDHAINLRCGPVGRAQPRAHPAARAVSEDQPAQRRQRPGAARSPTASTSTRRARRSKRDYVLDPHDPHRAGQRARRASPRRAPTARG